MKNQRLDFLSLRQFSYDTESFTQEALKYSKNSILIFMDFEKFILGHKPEHIGYFPTTIKYSISLQNPLYRPLLFFSAARFFLTTTVLLGYVCIRFRPKICWADHFWAGIIFGLFKKLGLCKRSIYWCGDWIITKQKPKLLQYLVNHVCWAYMDYFCARLSDIVVNISSNVSQERKLFWKKQVAQKEIIHFPPFMEINSKAINKNKINICFLGQIRPDSGLELILPLLAKLNKDYGIKLIIAGPHTPHLKNTQSQIEALGIHDIVCFHSWVQTESIHTILDDCFCGINLLTDEESYSSHTIPGKLIQYLQMLVPVLITKNNGLLTGLIQEHEMGIVVTPIQESIWDGILYLFENQGLFQNNIRRYFSHHQHLKVEEIIELSKKSQNEFNDAILTDSL